MGQKQASYNAATGAITGFFDTDDSPAAPGLLTINLTDAEWQAAIATSGYTVAGGALAAPGAAVLLTHAKTSKLAELSRACASAITGGFLSSALGAAHSYASDSPVSQTNLLSLGAANAAGVLWCEDSTGTWTLASHTFAQIQEVLVDWNSFRAAQQQRLVHLAASVNACITVADVNVIAW